jgi:phycoerythrobilin:ferredoxin oxidoreductase
LKRYNIKYKIDITLAQPFLDAAIALIKNRLDLQYYLIPESFEVKEATVGKGKKPT